MNDVVSLNHGSGGRLTQALIDRVFAGRFGMSLPLTDSALLKESDQILTFTTDSYVVDPLFFPGGNIGKLAVCGTVNDISVSGARPAYISASFIIEEGFPFKELNEIAGSMAEEAVKAGVRIVTGDTKVVSRGKCDKLFITTSGIGFLKRGLEHISVASSVHSGDRIIINGPVGNHSVAVIGARNDLTFSSSILSDCSALNHLISKILREDLKVHFMRDVTRGGLAGILNELAAICGTGITIEENSVPVDEPVKGMCEVLGFDPLYLANEGKVLLVAAREDADKVLDVMRSDPDGVQSSIIGEIAPDEKKLVILNTSIGGKRILDMPSGPQLPRIC